MLLRFCLLLSSGLLVSWLWGATNAQFAGTILSPSPSPSLLAQGYYPPPSEPPVYSPPVYTPPPAQAPPPPSIEPPVYQTPTYETPTYYPSRNYPTTYYR